MASLRSKSLWLLIVLVFVVLFLAWRAGTFDHVLVNVGLNAKPCARNGFGATFCGKELEERVAAQEQAKQEGEAAEHKVQEAAEEAKREASEQEAKLKREGQEAQARSEEAIRQEAQRQAEAPPAEEGTGP